MHRKPKERLPEYVGTFRALADKANPNWSGKERKETVRDQFIYVLFVKQHCNGEFMSSMWAGF